MIIDFLRSVNPISVIAFFCILGFLIYELILLRKEHLKKQKPNLPQFKANTTINPGQLQQEAASIVPPRKTMTEKQSKSPFILVAVLVCMVLLILAITVYIIYMNKPDKENQVSKSNIVIQEVSSKGLKIFTLDWAEITDSQESVLIKPGVPFYVAIETIDEADIDRARIRINENDWNIKHISDRFNKEKRVYYMEYTVATGESILKIDAQLHSETDGWLGD
ncbi:MAG: hypothetical protein WC489_02840 [Patescibacteria group bacterium]